MEPRHGGAERSAGHRWAGSGGHGDTRAERREQDRERERHAKNRRQKICAPAAYISRAAMVGRAGPTCLLLRRQRSIYRRVLRASRAGRAGLALPMLICGTSGSAPAHRPSHRALQAQRDQAAATAAPAPHGESAALLQVVVSAGASTGGKPVLVRSASSSAVAGLAVSAPKSQGLLAAVGDGGARLSASFGRSSTVQEPVVCCAAEPLVPPTAHCRSWPSCGACRRRPSPYRPSARRRSGFACVFARGRCNVCAAARRGAVAQLWADGQLQEAGPAWHARYVLAGW